MQSSSISRSLPVGFSVPCGSFHIQRLVSGPRLEVAGRWVTVTIETVCTWRARYTGQSRDTRTSPLPVSTVLTIARFAWFTCVHKLILDCYLLDRVYKLENIINQIESKGLTHQEVQEVLADL